MQMIIDKLIISMIDLLSFSNWYFKGQQVLSIILINHHAKNILASWDKHLMVLSVACDDCSIRVFDCSIRDLDLFEIFS